MTFKIQTIFKFLEKLNRFLDSFLILLIVSFLTFIFIRLNLQIQVIKYGNLIIIFLVSFIFLFFKNLRNKLFYLGLALILFLLLNGLSHYFPSLQEKINNQEFLILIWRFLLEFIFFPVILILYTIRSYRTKNKILLSFLGFLVLIFITNFGINKISFIKNYEKRLSKVIIIKVGDPLADLKLNPSISPASIERETKRLGLEKPLFKQFLLWLDGILVKADFGLTQQGENVLTVVLEPLRNTIILNLFILGFSWFLSIPLGVIAAINKNTFWDKIILYLSSVSLIIPSFLLSIFILQIALKVGFGKIGGLTSANFDDLNIFSKILDLGFHLFLPIVILTFVSLGGLIRQMRANLLDTLSEDYIKAARSRGIPEQNIFWKHALKNAINPLISLLGFEFANLFSGAAITEMILAYPGIGALTLEAARKLDINLIMFNLLLGTIMLMLGSFLSDFLLKQIDPRTKIK